MWVLCIITVSKILFPPNKWLQLLPYHSGKGKMYIKKAHIPVVLKEDIASELFSMWGNVCLNDCITKIQYIPIVFIYPPCQLRITTDINQDKSLALSTRLVAGIKETLIGHRSKLLNANKISSEIWEIQTKLSC